MSDIRFGYRIVRGKFNPMLSRKWFTTCRVGNDTRIQPRDMLAPADAGRCGCLCDLGPGLIDQWPGSQIHLLSAQCKMADARVQDRIWNFGKVDFRLRTCSDKCWLSYM
jgi:hypothetical protein